MKISTHLIKPLPVTPGSFPALAIVLLHATRIPPHLVLVINEQVWSYGLKGVSAGADLLKYIEHIKKSNMKVLAFELPALIAIEDIRKSADQFFNIQEPVNELGPTCFTPIRNMAELIVRKDFSEARFYFELINELILFNNILEIYQINMDSELSGPYYSLPEYNVQDLKTGIETYRKIKLS